MTNQNLQPGDEVQTTALHRLKSASAPKLGLRARGAIYYEVLADVAHQTVLLRLTQNDGGGNYSPEVVPFARIQSIAAALPVDTPVQGRVFRPCFKSRSQNNPGFLCCLLRAEGLLEVVPDKRYQHQISGNWEDWAQTMLLQPGEPIEISNVLIGDVLPLDTPTPSPQRRGRGRQKQEKTEDT